MAVIVSEYLGFECSLLHRGDNTKIVTKLLLTVYEDFDTVFVCVVEYEKYSGLGQL